MEVLAGAREAVIVESTTGCDTEPVGASRGSKDSMTDLSAVCDEADGSCKTVPKAGGTTASSTSESSGLSPLAVFSSCLNSSIIVVPWTLNKLTGQ